MHPVTRFRRKAVLLLFALLVCASVEAARPLQAWSAGPSCAKCIDSDTCARVSQSGSTQCTVKDLEPCMEGLGLCVIALNRPEEADSKDRLVRDTPFGTLALYPVGEGRFGAWSCNGKLIHLVQVGAEGNAEVLDPALHLGRYPAPALDAAASE